MVNTIRFRFELIKFLSVWLPFSDLQPTFNTYVMDGPFETAVLMYTTTDVQKLIVAKLLHTLNEDAHNDYTHNAYIYNTYIHDTYTRNAYTHNGYTQRYIHTYISSMEYIENLGIMMN